MQSRFGIAGQVLNDINALEIIESQPHTLIYYEAYYHLPVLKRLLQHCMTLPVKASEASLIKFLSDRWLQIRRTPASYEIAPHSPMNRACELLANALANSLEDASVSKHSLLMPTVTFSPEIKDAKWHQIIITEQEKAFLIRHCIDNLALWQTLSEDDRAFILSHSAFARSYFKAICLNKEVAEYQELFYAALERDDYVLTADYGPEGVKKLCFNMIGLIKDWRQVTELMARFIPPAEWQSFVATVSLEKLCYQFFGLNIQAFDSNSRVEIERQLHLLTKELKRRVQFLKQLIQHLDQKKRRFQLQLQQEPLLSVVLGLNLSELLNGSNYNLNELKRSILDYLYAHQSVLQQKGIQLAARSPENDTVLGGIILKTLIKQKKINAFYALSVGDLFAIMMNFEAVDPPPLSKTLFSNFILKQRKFFTRQHAGATENDSRMRAFFFCMTEIYERQRLMVGDATFSLGASRSVKLQCSQLFKKFLISPARHLADYLVDDETISEDNLNTLLMPLQLDTLGGLAKRQMDLVSAMETLHAVPEKRIHFRFPASHQGDMQELKLNFNGINNLQEFSEALVHLPKQHWQAFFQTISFTTLLELFLGKETIRNLPKRDAKAYHAGVLQLCDNQFAKLVQEPIEFICESEIYSHAYFYCLAEFYERQRNKKSDYASNGARVVSFFTRVHFKKEKIDACRILKQFILSAEGDLNARQLQLYLTSEYKSLYKLYWDILTSDTLGDITKCMFASSIKEDIQHATSAIKRQIG